MTTNVHAQARSILVERFLNVIAEMKADGECPTHGLDCLNTQFRCAERFIMENDDAVETLGELIASARELLNA